MNGKSWYFSNNEQNLDGFNENVERIFLFFSNILFCSTLRIFGLHQNTKMN